MTLASFGFEILDYLPTFYYLVANVLLSLRCKVTSPSFGRTTRTSSQSVLSTTRVFLYPVLSLIGGAAIANLAIACPAALQQQQRQQQGQQDGAQLAEGGDVASQPAGEEVDGAGTIQPLAPAPAAGGPVAPVAESFDSAVVFGPPSLKEANDLRKEALSTKHLLRHKPFNKYCEHCCKCKMAAKRHFR